MFYVVCCMLYVVFCIILCFTVEAEIEIEEDSARTRGEETGK